MSTPEARPQPFRDVPGWTRIGTVAAYVAAAALLTQSLLYVLDASGVLEPQVTFRATSEGLQSDLASYYTAFHERQHRLWWNIAVRDTVGPLGHLAVVVLVLAVRQVLGPGRPKVDLAVLFVSVGALTAAACDVAFLSQIATWRGGGFRPTPDIVAFGRASEVLDHAVSYVLHASYAVLALGFLCFGAALRSAGPTSARLAGLSYALAAGLLAVVVLRVVGLGAAYEGATAVTGVVLGPALTFLLGRALPRLASAAPVQPLGQPRRAGASTADQR